MNRFFCLLIFMNSGWIVSAQNLGMSEPLPCKTSEAMQALYLQYPESKTESEGFETASAQWKSNTTFTYVIPAVFHVYGTTQNGYPVNPTIIHTALAMLNDDFHGLNADFATVHTQFSGTKSTLDIQFALALLDTAGNTTTGIRFHPVTAGYGNWTGYDSLIAADAWDNYKYMNVYIMGDLYNDGVTNNSGISWYPDTYMSDHKTARVVYNGAYLGTNCNSWNPEFASTLTHEFGHFLNLIHTFEGGCTSPNDNVADTPPCTTGQGCHNSATSNAPLNCNNNLVNAENYMDYNNHCYKMFSAGQVSRMIAGLNHPARISLWQYSNLVATGLSGLFTSLNSPVKNIEIAIYPNPAKERFSFQVSGTDGNCTIEITNTAGMSVYKKITDVHSGTFSSVVDCSAFASGLYYFSVTSNGSRKVLKLAIQ